MSGLRIPQNKWMTSEVFLAQVGHTLGGASIIVLATMFGGFRVWWWAWLAIVVYAAIKEYWYDAVYELPKQTFSDNTLDFAFYQFGAAIGVLLTWLAHHLHRIG